MERRQGVAAERTNFSERIADIGSELGERGRLEGGIGGCFGEGDSMLLEIWLSGVAR